ncbi:MAG: response regulator [Bdellovibrionales bacterium]
MENSRVILIVDDEEELRKLLSLHLEREGYRVYSVNSAEKALDLLSQGTHIDAILSDIRMPGGMSGIELMQKLKSNSIKIPINILMSGHAVLGSDQLENLELDYALSKPFSVKKLSSLLSEKFNEDGFFEKRRVFPRIKHEVNVFETNQKLTTRTQDISLGGVFISLEKPFAIGTQFSAELNLAGSVLNTELEVKWTRNKAVGEKLPGMGCEFLNLDEPKKETLRIFFSSTAAENL